MADTNEKDEKSIKEFNWDNPDGLRFVSDDMLKVCDLLYEKAQLELEFVNASPPISLSLDDGTINNTPMKQIIKISLSNNIAGLCNYKYTLQDLLSALESEEKKLPDGVNLFKDKKTVFTHKVYSSDNQFPDYQIEDICVGCKFEKCPKFVLAYIKYLHDKGLYEEKINDRAIFRENNDVNSFFNFEWKVENILKKVDDLVYEYAQALVDKGLVIVKPCLAKNNTVRIYNGQTCLQIARCNLDIQKIDDNNKGIDNYNNWNYISRNLEEPSYLCNDYKCRLNGCPTLVAGIIYYLRKSGKNDIIKKCRDYYHENKEQQDLIVEEEINTVIEKTSKKMQKSFKSIYEYKDRISNIDELVDTLANNNQKNLHIAITGDLGVGKIELAKKIGKVLFDAGKTFKAEPIIERLAKFTYQSVSNEDGTLKPRRWYHSVEYSKNEENCLYVLTDIDEFLHDYRLHNEKQRAGAYYETKQKQFKYAIELLTNMFYNNYFIIVGSQEDVDSLLELSIKIKYTFQNNIFNLPNMSIEEMQKEYNSLLKPELLAEYRDNEEEYKKRFIDFVSLNEKQLPYSNSELAKYLAVYSNTKNAIEFPPDVYNKKTIDESLAGIIGLNQIKKRIKEFEKYMLYRMKAQNLGLKLASSNMHMIFEGNPGTGKTTIARIMAQMLYDMGIVKENKLIEVERKDLIANYIGQTATKTAEVIESAKNGVLFIDEAYELAKGKDANDFGGEAIATLIKAMEDHKDKLVVIFAGYTKEMHDFINMNPGIASRIGYTFTFDDYSPEELCQIFNSKMEKMGFTLNDVDNEILNICDYFSKRKNFGNGRFVDKLIQETLVKHSQNCTDNINTIEKIDIPTLEELSNYSTDDNKDVDEMLENIIGMANIKEKIKEFEAYIKFVKVAREKKIKVPAQNMHMIFTGNPGTGKTTIARIVAQLLYSMGVIHENKLIEVESKDLVAEYVGQSAPKTAAVIERAMGGVLFIDEAYSLANLKGSNSDFGADVIATLIKAMEDHKGEFVVIFAGYKDEMKKFVEVNPGIASRIGYTLHFEDYSAKELEEIYYKKLSSMEMEISNPAKEKIKAIMTYFHSVENIGNGRFADRVLQESIIRHSKNLLNEPYANDERIKIINENDIPEVMEMAKLLINGDEMPDLSKITPESLRRTAYHELGHAYVGFKLFATSGIKVLTINAEGAGTLGYVEYDGSNLGLTSSKNYLERRIVRLLAGMASEQTFLGYYENGNYSDLEHATRIAKRMVSYYGMSDLGLAQIIEPSGELEYEVQKEVNKILDKCFKYSLTILENGRTIIDNAVNYVLEKKEVTGEELATLFENNGIMPTNN